MKRMCALTAILFLVSGLLFAGGQAEPEKKQIRLLNLKVEIAEEFDKLKAEYEKAYPDMELVVETVGGGADYFADLKVKLASGNPPDIYQNTGYSILNQWVERLTDLSDQPWVDHLVEGAAKPVTKDGKIYGQPEMMEGYFIIYNKDLFAEAGITQVPRTLRELEAACKKLQAKDILPFSSAYQEFWILGFHILNIGLAAQDNPDQFIENAKAGKARFVGNQAFIDMLNYLDLTVKYGNPNTIATDYNTQVSDFASGRAAMIQQGNWVQPTLDKVSPDMKVGIFPVPTNNTPAEKIYVATANNWVIDKESEVQEEAKAFLNWMVMSEEGQKIIIENFKMIPPFTNFDYDPAVLGSITVGMKKYLDEGNVLPWYWEKLPPGTPQEASNLIQAYIAGEITRDKLLQDLQDAIVRLAK